METPVESRVPIDRRQAEAVAEALLAEGRARQHARLLRRWRLREMRRGQGRSALLAMGVVLALWGLCRVVGVEMERVWLWAVGLLAYALALRRFRPRTRARAVIES